METMLNALIWGLAIISVGLMIIAAIGVTRLADAMSRQHAVTKAGTISVGIMAISLSSYAIFVELGSGWIIRLIVLLLLLLISIPIASNAIARSALYENSKVNNTDKDITSTPPSSLIDK
jgi:multicomponent Na+:H+ antiporter subunit G